MWHSSLSRETKAEEQLCSIESGAQLQSPAAATLMHRILVLRKKHFDSACRSTLTATTRGQVLVCPRRNMETGGESAGGLN